jgi:hypothetical protein
MFHDFAPVLKNASELTKSLTVDPNLFESMMDYLYKNSFIPITLEEIKDM